MNTSPLGASAEQLVVHLLMQLVTILVATRLVSAGLKRLGQTDVAGEILGGLLLGPSFLGALAPGALAWLFPPATAPIFTGLSQLGLVLLMFQIGLEFEFGQVARTERGKVIVISLVGITVPFALGYASADFFWTRLPEPARPDELGFRLFFAVAMSITAIPILGRIFMELGLSHTRLAALTISAAAVDDVCGWLILGVISLMVSGQFDGAWIALRLAGLSAYLAAVFWLARPFLKRFVAGSLARHGALAPSALTVVLVALFVSATITSTLHVFAIIGGFVIGVALHDDRRFVNEWKRRISPLVNTLLLPMFFTYTGLRTSMDALDDAAEWLLCAGVIAIAFAGKLGGVFVGARAMGMSARDSLAIATCMNTRALMELVALNIGLDLGVLPPSMFTKLVIMAIASTFIATPLIRRLTRGQQRPVTLYGESEAA
jgi:Kef-type K+ transport system membrane component KefB